MKLWLGLTTMVLFLSACVQVIEQPKKNLNQIVVTGTHDIAYQIAPNSRFTINEYHLAKNSLSGTKMKYFYQLYNNAISKNLQQFGYVPVMGSVSDFTVTFAIALGSDLSDKTITEKFGVTPGLHTDNKHEKGSFLIYVQNNRTGQRVWRGAAQGFVHEDYDEEERQARLIKIVNQVLNQFHQGH